MKNRLLIGASVAAISMTMAGRAQAQASNNACGTVSTTTNPNVVSCVSDPSKYPNGIVYNQNDLAVPAGLEVDIYNTAVVQPNANVNAVQVIGSANNVAEINVRSGATVTASGTGYGLVGTPSGTGRAIVDNGGTVTAGNDGVHLLGNNAVFQNASTTLNVATNTVTTAIGSVTSTTDSAVTGSVGLTVTNVAGGTLKGGTDATYGYAVQFAGNGGTFNNYGSATGGAGGVTANTNLSGAGTGVTLNLYAGSTTGAIALGTGNDTVNLFTGTTTTTADTAVDPITGLQTTLRAAGTYAASNVGAIALGTGTNTVALNGAGTGNAAGTLNLSTVTGLTTLNKTGAGAWTLTGASASPAATIVAGTGGNASTDGTLTISATGLTGAVYANGATVRATGTQGFGSGTLYASGSAIQFGASTTDAGAISLQSHDATNAPTTLQADNGVTVTLNGPITQGTGNNINGQSIAANQPLVFGLSNGGTATFVLGNASTTTPNNWTGATTVNAGVTLRGTTASISGSSIVDNGTVDFNQATAGTSNQAIGGTGLVQIDGGGNVALTGAVTATQGVVIGANSTATLSNASGTGNTVVTLSGNNATLAVATNGTVTATNGGAVFGTGQTGTVNNAGTITSTGGYTAVYFNPGTGTDTVTNAGTISGYNAIYGGSALTVTNTGTLTATNNAGILTAAGSGAATITNSGTIQGATGAGTYGVALQGGGTVTNNAGGTISSGYRGVYTSGASSTVNNSGSITGGTDNAVSMFAGGNVTNFAGGTLTATGSGGWGVYTAGAGTIDNRGTVNADSGLVSNSGATVFTNSGTITAAVNGVWGYGASVNLTNTGTVTGGTGAAVRSEAAGSTITNSGTLKAATGSNGQGVYLSGGALTDQAGGTISGDGTGAAIKLAANGNTLNLQAGSTVNGLIDASATTDASGVYTLAGTLNGGFTGGTGADTLTLITGAAVTGTLDGNTGTDTLVLDGTGTNGTLGSQQVVDFETGTKNGTGTWTLTGTTAASPTIWAVNAGTLAVAGGNALADSAAVTIAGGATLALQANETIDALGGAGNVTLGANTLTVGGGNGGADFSGVVSGSGGLTKIGTGTETLSGANTYTGATTVSAGTLALGAANVFSDSTSLTVATGATLNMGTFSDTVGTAAINGTLNGTGTLTAATYTLNGATVNANLGAGVLTQAGGTSLLNGTEAAATVNVNAGTLQLGAADRLADNAAVTVATGAALDVQGFTDTVGTAAINGTLNGTGTLTAATYTLNGALINANLGTGTLTQADRTSVLNGTEAAATVNINAGTLQLGASDRLADTAAVTVASGATLDVQGFTDMVGAAAINGTLNGTGTLTAATYTLNGATINANLGAGVLAQEGGSSLLNGTEAAATVNVNAGTLQLGASDRLADTAAVTVASGAALDVQGFTDTVGTAAIKGTLNGTGTLTAATYTLNGALINANLGTGTLTQADRTSVLNGTEAAATVNVNAGTLRLGAADRLADNAAVTVATGAALDVQGFTDTVGTATINGTLNGTGTLTAATYTLNGATINANLGTGVLTQAGGTSLLNGTEAAATVNVNAGTLRLGASDRLADTATLTVATGAVLDVQGFTDTVGTAAINGTLNGTGTLTAATYTLNGALINANLGTGTLTQAGGTSLLNGTEAAATVNVNAGTLQLGASDRLADTAALTVASGAVLDVQGFTDTVGTAAINGTLNGTGTLTAATYTLNGALINANLGAGVLTQAGGTSLLNGTEAAATVNVDAGTLQLGAADRLADNAAVTVATGAALDVQGFSDTVGTAAINGTLNGTGTLTAATYTLNGANINANLGTGVLTQTGGTSLLNGTEAAATVNVDAGTLQLGASDRLADSAAVTVATGAVLDVQGFTDTVGTAAINGTLNGTGTLTAATYTLNGATINANLGAGVLAQEGGSSLLNGTEAAATVNVNAGTLQLGASDRLADTAALTVATGAALDVQGFTDTVGTAAINGTLNGTGTLTAATYTLNGATINANLGTGVLAQEGGSSLLNGTEAAATVNVDAGTLSLGANDRLADTAAVTVAAGATLNLATFSDLVGTAAINGTLNGTGTLTAATYTLNGATVNANLGTGALTQAGGTSVLNGTANAGAVNVTAGTLQLGASDRLADTAAIGVATGATLDLQNFSDTVGTASINGTLAGTGTLTAGTYTLNGATVNANLGTGTLTQAGGTSVLNGTANAGTVNVTAGTLQLGASDRLADTAAVGVASGSTLDLQGFTDTVGSLSLAGTLAGTGTLTAATYALNGATVNANLGAGTLVQASGTSVLNGTATAGTVNVNGGTLSLGASNRLADTAAVTVASGATLNLNAFSDTVGSAAISGTLAGMGTLTAASYALNGATVNANLGAGTLTQTGGTSTLNGTAAATTVNVNAGTLSLGAANRLADTAAVAVASGATLNLNGFTDTVGTAAINGTLAGTGTLTAATYTLNGGTVNANLGAGTLTQAGGNSTLNGTAGAATVNVNTGTLSLGANNRLADNAAVTVASGATLAMNAFTDTVGTAALNGTLAGTGTLTAATYTLNGATVTANLGAGTLTQAGGSSLLNGTAAAATVNVNAGTLALGASDRLADTAALSIAAGATFNLNAFNDTVGTAAINGTLAGTGTLTAATYTLNGGAVNANLGAGTVMQAGGTSVLNGTASATTVAVNAGTLSLGASNRLADNAVLTVASGATLAMNGFIDTVGTAAISGTLAGTGTLTAATYTLNGATVAANLGAGTLAQAGGTSVLSGTAAATAVNVNAGILRLGAADRIADAAVVTLASGATLDLAGFGETIGSLAGAGTVALGAGTLATGAGNTDSGFTGALTGTGDLTKVGTGVFTLTGNEALTGRLNANAGTLVLNGTTAGGVRVQGGTFAGNATIGGALTLSAGTLAPGTTAAIGQIQAASLAATGGTLAVDFTSTTADLLKITGTASLGGATVTPSSLEASANYKLTQTYQVLQAGSITGAFTNGASFTQVSTANPDLYYRLRTDITPNAVVLEVRRVTNYGTTLGAGGTSNQAAVGSALTTAELTASGSFLTFLQAVDAETPAQRQATFDSIGGESVADVSTSASLIATDFTNLLRHRAMTGGPAGSSAAVGAVLGGRAGLAAARASATGLDDASGFTGDTGARGGAWAQGFGGVGRVDGRGGSATIDDHSYGGALGVDGRFGGVTLGLAFSVASLDADVNARAATNKGTLYQGGGYAAYDDGQLYGSLVGSYFGGKVDSLRTVAVGGVVQGQASGRSTVSGAAAGLTLGYRIPLGTATRFTPEASVDGTWTTRDGFTETGAGNFDLSVARQHRDLYQATLEGRFSHVAQSSSGWAVEPYIGAGATVQFGDLDAITANALTGAPTGTSGFVIQGAKLAPVLGLVTAGLEAHPSDKLAIGVDAEARLSDRQRDGRFQVHLRLGF